MTPLKCIIVDDEPLAVRLIESYVKRHPGVELVEAFTSAEAALMRLRRGDIDLALLDIQMPGMTGLKLAEALDGMSTAVIFITAYRNYAFEGFKVHATDYLLKPVSYDEFAAAVDRYISSLPQATAPAEPQVLTVRSDYRTVRIPIDDITHVEGLKDYVKIYCASRPMPVLTLMSMKSVEQSLPESDFIRIHRSYIVSIRHITAYDRTSVTVAGTTLPVGDTYRQRVVERL